MSSAEECTLGLRIYTKIPRAAETDVARLASAGVGDLSDVMRGTGAVDPGIRPIYSPMPRIFGSAITVELSPGNGLLLRAAIDCAKPGDVIVANAHGVTSRAILGGALGMHMVHRGARGIVVDGAVRDVQEFRALGFPVMARAITPRSGTSAAGWGEVNVPIACGGTIVWPGDVVVGDEEGLVVVPRLWVGRVAEGLGKTSHPRYAPSSILDRLASLPPDTPVLGIERVQQAVAERNGVIVDGTYESHGRIP